MSSALAEAFAAGEFIAAELEARGWTIDEFASELGRPTPFAEENVAGTREITHESAADGRLRIEFVPFSGFSVLESGSELIGVSESLSDRARHLQHLEDAACA